jgi:hypothetical protein
MTQDELAQLRARVRKLFRGGDDDDEITALWMRECVKLDYDRAIIALNEYALRDGGPNRRFIVGKFLKAYESQPQPTRTVLVDRDKAAREAALREARQAEEIAAQREERESDRRTVLTANPLIVGEIVAELVGWGAPRPPAQPETWPMPWYLAVADLLLDRVRAAPTERGYYEQVRDDRGGWAEDHTKPLRPLPAREWWRVYGAPGLAARGVLTAGQGVERP